MAAATVVARATGCTANSTVEFLFQALLGQTGECRMVLGTHCFLLDFVAVTVTNLSCRTLQGCVTEEIPLDPVLNKTGSVWHVFLPNVGKNLLYGYRVDGQFSLEDGNCFDSRRVLVDPYAKVRWLALKTN